MITWSTSALVLGGLSLIGLGLYFIFLRPALLPEDSRYMGATPAAIQATIPGLSKWLQKVFWVMGGYMLSTGLLTLDVALTTFRERAPGAAAVMALVGLTSIGWMTVVNFILRSDFRWVILLLTAPWAIALILFGLGG